ncbi:hypothetical protein LI142_00050 [Eubacterium limosum]|uniref:DUF1579 domain-containing protein n=1 Tax=Eubacterium limosum TaxID=1736 RepID=A0ABT5UR60_EUBLI|nr:hypothetical protein [Eubacterium limosum]MCB6567882.1 hypothetical protein [Eubacterium limosum]MDE1470331.1 hypothetical protein [Eubacterium limosum]
MQDFLKKLTSECKNTELPEEFNYFGKLVGRWKIDYIDNSTSRTIKGEWHFSWVLEGMAIQDIIILPGYECGTTLRVYNPGTHAWDIAYCFTGKIIRLEAKKENGLIILTDIENKRRKWVFAKIEDNNFHWQDVTVKDDGEWHINFDLYAERI